jgi:hypothetical protein
VGAKFLVLSYLLSHSIFASFFDREKGGIPSMFDKLCGWQFNLVIGQPMVKAFKEYCSLFPPSN